MIGICGIPSESPVALVLKAASQRGIETVMLNQRNSATDSVEIQSTSAGIQARYHRGGTTLDMAAFSGAFVRMADFHALPEYGSQGKGETSTQARMATWHALISDWMEMAQIPVLNRLKPSNSNMSKPYQAQLIASAGLSTPTTIVTNSRDAVLAFRRRHGRVIYKSISAHRSIVKELEEGDMQRLSRIKMLPTQFQALVLGNDVRVHVVGDEIFATLIESDAVDYRYAAEAGSQARYTPTELPESIRVKCLRVAERLGLPLCGIDLKLTPEGEWVCFEVNPAPAYSCFEEQTGQPIADAIVNYLSVSTDEVH